MTSNEVIRSVRRMVPGPGGHGGLDECAQEHAHTGGAPHRKVEQAVDVFAVFVAKARHHVDFLVVVVEVGQLGPAQGKANGLPDVPGVESVAGEGVAIGAQPQLLSVAPLRCRSSPTTHRRSPAATRPAFAERLEGGCVFTANGEVELEVLVLSWLLQPICASTPAIWGSSFLAALMTASR